MSGILRIHSYTGLATAPEDEPVTGLDFQGNGSTSGIIAWNSTILGGTAPFTSRPATYIWRCYPRTQSGYWTFLFHADWNTGAFDPNHNYYGFHPYPSDPTTDWEISADGDDFVDDTIVPDRWYTQAATVTAGRVMTYYWDLDDPSAVLVHNGAGTATAQSDPAIIIGDAPWNLGNEIPNVILRGWQFYDGIAMTLQQIESSLLSPTAIQTPWYLKLNPTPDDIADDSGNGNDPQWFGAGRPLLWEEPV